MKIMHVSSRDNQGGAHKASYRIHQALLKADLESEIFVQRKFSDDFRVHSPKSKLQKVLAQFRVNIDLLPLRRYKNRSDTTFSAAIVPSNYVKQINRFNPDIIHLHWINEGMFRIEDLTKFNKPIVWGLQDMWPFTGGCHYDEGCGRYVEKCGRCKVLRSSVNKDLSRKVFIRKQKSFNKINNLTITGVSTWICDSAKRSSLFKDRKVVKLPNLLDTSLYKPISKEIAHSLMGIPKNRKTVLFGAISATSDKRKGFEILKKALDIIKTDNVQLVIFGSSRPEISFFTSHPTYFMGHLFDDYSLCALYNCADVMVAPSLQEAFGQTLTESMSCGTPVVSFNSTGPKDIVDHKVNGYLAEPYNHKSLAAGIDWVLNHTDHEQLRINSRNKVVMDFDADNNISKYIDLYKSIL